MRGVGGDMEGMTSDTCLRPELYFYTPVQHVLPLITVIISGKEIPRTVLRHSYFKNARLKSQ